MKGVFANTAGAGTFTYGEVDCVLLDGRYIVKDFLAQVKPSGDVS